MASLRARVLASVLVLAALGLIILAAVTYAEQSSFLQGRLNQEVAGAGPAVSQALDKAGLKPADSDGDNDDAQATHSSQGGSATSGSGAASSEHAPAPSPAPVLPPGTYGQRRSSSGKLIGHRSFGYGEATLPEPVIPARVPIERLFTVGSVGSSGLRYRAYAIHDPHDSGVTIVAVPMREIEQTLSRLLVVEALVIAGVLAALGASAFFVVRIGLRPLDNMEVTAGQIAAGDLSRRVSPATPKTEVGRLGLALNAMLDRLEQAFAARQASEDRLRRFLADASHELRTPLASIRGYAELFRMGATGDEAGTKTAMRRIEDESKRMGVLVEDLLTLARLDEAPRLQRVAVNMAHLADDAVEDARATDPDRPIAIEATSAALVYGDPHQLRQVLANLMRNALVHTPRGAPIEVTVAAEGASVKITVSDHGPGLPDGAAESLFDRFWRAEGGRERGKAGAGLGLAIVREITAAHGGEITAVNAPGGGARFILDLPAATTSEQSDRGAPSY